MEKVITRHKIALQTLATLKTVLDKIKAGVPEEYNLEMRDSAIQRFEYSIDTFWKFLKIYMQEFLSMHIESISPRAIMKDALDAAIITNDEFKILIYCVMSRNETSHAYNQMLAEEIFGELYRFYTVMHAVITRIKA